MAEVGYIRVSSAGQKTDRQLADVYLDKTFIEKISGASTKRPQLRECFNYLREGDRLHVHSMDRLARNLADLQKMVETLTNIGITIRFHKEGLTFTGQDDAMAKLMLQIMGAVAEFERSLILERQAEGIKKAKEKGVKWGPKPKFDDNQKREMIALVDAGQEKTAVAEKFGISRPTLYKILRQREALGLAEAQLSLDGMTA